MTNTQGLDALAALCGSTTAASEENIAAASAVPMGVSPTSSQLTAASLYAQAQLQQQAHAQALQMQQVQQVLAMRQALQCQQQAQQQQATAVQVQAAAAIQGQAQAQAAAAPALPPQLQAQLGMLQAAQQQQEHQHQQQQTNNTYNQVQQALAALAQQQQQQHQQQQQQPTIHPSLAALSQGLPPALTSLAATSGGQVVPGTAAAYSRDAVIITSPALQAKANEAQSSPSTIAMPPPPNVHVPLMPPSNNSSKNASKARAGPDAPEKKQPQIVAAASSKRRPRSATAAEAEPQPPIQDIISEWEDKKQAKRAANRLSAHLSRKRKKMFIEDLKDENLELRRKEQILRSIPDLIVVFDSSGCISFVSHSVTRFLDHSAEELEDTSFWDLLTEDSVRLIKSAFMDALAVKRPPEEDSTLLANGGSITVKLVHKNSGGDEEEEDCLMLSLKGVVHFTGESPECVCSIRPEDGGRGTSTENKTLKPAFRESTLAPASARVRLNRAVIVPAGAVVANQISDIDSEKS
mmetsp:Transcript_41667/g.88767  ORF Transcript_41667/g.88767 Transcript_41667/m.88767 type:complete len:522 (-) Transcript_41667:284-1849(-)